MREKFGAMIFLVGLLILVGTAGASDVCGLPIRDIIPRCAVGLAMLGGGGYIGGLFR